MKNIIIFLFLITPLLLNAQSEWNDNDRDQAIGFGCSVSGTSTKPVNEMFYLFSNKKFDSIKKLLDSDLLATQYLSAFFLEKLKKKKKVELNQCEIERINQIKSSTELVPVCAGCTYWEKEPMNELFNKKHVIYKGAKSWFKFYFRIHYE